MAAASGIARQPASPAMLAVTRSHEEQLRQRPTQGDATSTQAQASARLLTTPRSLRRSGCDIPGTEQPSSPNPGGVRRVMMTSGSAHRTANAPQAAMSPRVTMQGTPAGTPQMSKRLTPQQQMSSMSSPASPRFAWVSGPRPSSTRPSSPEAKAGALALSSADQKQRSGFAQQGSSANHQQTDQQGGGDGDWSELQTSHKTFHIRFGDFLDECPSFCAGIKGSSTACSTPLSGTPLMAHRSVMSNSMSGDMSPQMPPPQPQLQASGSFAKPLLPAAGEQLQQLLMMSPTPRTVGIASPRTPPAPFVSSRSPLGTPTSGHRYLERRSNMGLSQSVPASGAATPSPSHSPAALTTVPEMTMSHHGPQSSVPLGQWGTNLSNPTPGQRQRVIFHTPSVVSSSAPTTHHIVRVRVQSCPPQRGCQVQPLEKYSMTFKAWQQSMGECGVPLAMTRAPSKETVVRSSLRRRTEPIGHLLATLGHASVPLDIFRAPAAEPQDIGPVIRRSARSARRHKTIGVDRLSRSVSVRPMRLPDGDGSMEVSETGKRAMKRSASTDVSTTADDSGGGSSSSSSDGSCHVSSPTGAVLTPEQQSARSKLLHALQSARLSGLSVKPDDVEADDSLEERLDSSPGLTPTKLSVADAKHLVRTALIESWSVGLDCVDKFVACAEGFLHADARHRSDAASKLSSVVAEAKELQTEDDIKALRAMKRRLRDEIALARRIMLDEDALREAERQRRRIHNLIEDMRGQNRVVCRVRPMTDKELSEGDQEAVRIIDDMTLEVPKGSFSFDGIFAPGTQEEVFEDCRDLVQSVVDGHNVTIFTYGHTGTGKTHTMFGSDEDPGLASRAIEELFAIVGSLYGRRDVQVTASMIELYNNQISDLLMPTKGTRVVDGQHGLKIGTKGGKQGGLQCVEGLTDVEVQSAREMRALLKTGAAMRAVADNHINPESSRSHMLFSIRVSSRSPGSDKPRTSQCTLCDLGGCERMHPKAGPEQQREAIEINRSLSALVDVVEAVCKKYKQVPYRNHKLTQLLQDSIGGTAKTLLIATVSPAASCEHDTYMALRYAGRLKSIITGAALQGQ